MNVNEDAAFEIRNAASAAALANGASSMTLMAALCLMASHFAWRHCGADAAWQDQWFADLVTASKLQLQAEGRRRQPIND